MIKKKNVGRIYGVCLATMYAALATIAIHGVWHGPHVALVFLLFISLWIGFYCAGVMGIYGAPSRIG
jgi:predicted Na+-dependent transporter